MDYEQMQKAIRKHVVGTGSQLLKTRDLVTKITLLSHTINNTSGFSLIFSLSHIPADGYTYYKLLNAFFNPSKMIAMNYQRKFDKAEQIEGFIGKTNYRFTLSAPMVVNVLKNLIFGKKVQFFSRYVDEEKVSSIKEAYSKDAKSEFPFISTNDIITSNFCNATNSRLTLSAINLRNRIEGLGNEDAGNYEFVLLLDNNHFDTPEKIRKVLSSKGRFEANNGKMPGILEALKSNITLITNASSFIEDYQLGEFKQILHLPIFKSKNIFCDFAAVYKAHGNKRAILYFGKTTTPKKYFEKSELGESVSESLFR